MRLGEHCGQYLAELADERDDLWVLDGDLADSDGAVHFALAHEDRFVMGGIAEQSLVSVAAGMASCGARPWVFSFASFLCYRAYDQIRVGLSQSRQPVALVGSHAGGCAARNGKTHATLNDLALMTTLPGMRVWSPAGPAEVRLAVDDVLDAGEPAYLRLPRRPLADPPGPPAPLRWIGGAAPVALVSTGLATHWALDARGLLAARGVDAGVLHCGLLAPLPAEALQAELAGCSHVFVVEDHAAVGGLAAMVQSQGGRPDAVAIGWPPSWSGSSGDDEELLRLHGLDPSAICERVAARVEGRVEGRVGGRAANGRPHGDTGNGNGTGGR